MSRSIAVHIIRDDGKNSSGPITAIAISAIISAPYGGSG